MNLKMTLQMLLVIGCAPAAPRPVAVDEIPTADGASIAPATNDGTETSLAQPMPDEAVIATETQKTLLDENPEMYLIHPLIPRGSGMGFHLDQCMYKSRVRARQEELEKGGGRRVILLVNCSNYYGRFPEDTERHKGFGLTLPLSGMQEIRLKDGRYLAYKVKLVFGIEESQRFFLDRAQELISFLDTYILDHVLIGKNYTPTVLEEATLNLELWLSKRYKQVRGTDPVVKYAIVAPLNTPTYLPEDTESLGSVQ